jgi:hypothetical protein
MQLVTHIDQLDGPLNNEAMWKRAATRVKNWRKEHDEMNQITFAKLAKISVGCLQGFETATRHTRNHNLIKIAAAMGITKEDLLSEDQPATEKANPLLIHLRTEDLRLANAFHHAGGRVKVALLAFFHPEVSEESRERIAVMLEHLLRLTADHLLVIEKFLVEFETDDHPTSQKKSSG